MAKRHSPGSEGSDAEDSQLGFEERESLAKRRKLVEFEPICLKNVSSVSSLHEKQLFVANYKLAEAVKYKNKVISDMEKEIERLREKQITDENTSCTINRHWNNLEEQVRTIVLRGANPEEANKLFEELSNGQNSSNFLEEIVQLEDSEREQTYDRRVQWSVRILKQILAQISEKAELFRLYTKKIEGLFEELKSSGVACPDTVAELVQHVNCVAEENSRVKKEMLQMQSQMSSNNVKLQKAEETIIRDETKIEELTKDLDNAKHDLEKCQRKLVKFEFRLYNLAKEGVTSCEKSSEGNGSHPEGQQTQTQAQQNGVLNGSERDSQEIQSLRDECELQSELASNRLNEIKELNERVKKLVEEVERANFKANKSIEEGQDAKEFVELKSYFSLALDELSRVKEENNTVIEERELIRQEMLRTVDEMKNNEQETMKAVLAEKEKLVLENQKLKNDIEQLSQERTMEGKKNSVSGDIETIDMAMKSQISQLRAENQRLKKKWKDSVNILAKVQKDLESERQLTRNAVIIDLDAIDEAGTPPESILPGEDINNVEELKELVSKLQNQLAMVQNLSAIDKERVELAASEKHLKTVNARLRHHICRTTNMERREKLRHLEAELTKKLEAKEHELQSLHKSMDEKAATLEAMSLEMDSTGQALDDLITQNAELLKKNKSLEDERMHMMGERITTNQSNQKLVEERVVLDAQISKIKKQLELQTAEYQGIKESLVIQKEAMSTKTIENSKITRMLEGLRKQVMELSRESGTLKNSNEKMVEQLKSLQETVISKAQQHEVNVQKNKRLEEQAAILRKRLERLRKSEKLGSTDAVLMEEIRTLKEQLTCPSCQVNKKDAILTKCFHVFCLDCLQTRYNTRQRKCPKCNANFGANDFQRAFIT